MNVGDICLKETSRSWFLIAIVKVFICVGTIALSRILQPNYFILQSKNSLSFAFIPREQS